MTRIWKVQIPWWSVIMESSLLNLEEELVAQLAWRTNLLLSEASLKAKQVSRTLWRSFKRSKHQERIIRGSEILWTRISAAHHHATWLKRATKRDSRSMSKISRNPNSLIAGTSPTLRVAPKHLAPNNHNSSANPLWSILNSWRIWMTEMQKAETSMKVGSKQQESQVRSVPIQSLKPLQLFGQIQNEMSAFWTA